ncbi:MAG: GIY-YIG nuclease family protein, partial [Spirochaetales bacterium]|nr:GIY-YIG nuclease family protein [Spirochaetales bacterium]
GMRGRAYYLENYIKDITVNQIFEYRYTGEIFPGYENINHDYSVLETIFKTEKSDWKTALENVKGVYLITDKKNGKMYVGSAYGEGGRWERWSNYICSLDGGNKQLMELINNKGEKYVQNNFKYTLLEIFAMHASAESIIERENYWKEKLMTREHGYNSN